MPLSPVVVLCQPWSTIPMFFDIALNSEPLGCISLRSRGQRSTRLFANKVPKIAENIHTLTTGEKQFGYKGSCFHRIIQGFMCQGGDFTCHYGMSIYGQKFDDKNFIQKHIGPGILSMVNAGPNPNGSQFSQFFICSAKTEWFNGKHVVFGKVKEDMNIVEAMERFGSRNGKTSTKITITDCGQLQYI